MGARASKISLREVLSQRVGFRRLGGYRHSSSSSSRTNPKIPHSSKKGILLTGAIIGLIIAGGAYVSKRRNPSDPKKKQSNRQNPASARIEGQQKPDLIKKEPIKKSEVPKTFHSSVGQINPISLGTHVIASIPLKNSGDPAPSPFSSGATPPSKQESFKKAEVPKILNTTVEQRNLIDSSLLGKHVTKKEDEKLKVPKTSTSSIPHKNSGDPSSSPFSSSPTLSPLKPLPLSLVESSQSPSPSGPPDSLKKAKYVWAQKGTTTPLYVIPDELKKLIEKDIVPPEVLKKDLSPEISNSSVPHKNLGDRSSSPFLSGPSLTPLKPLPLSHVESSQSPSPSGPPDSEKKAKYVWAQKGITTPLYVIPDELKKLIKKDIVPKVLKEILTPSSYKDYFSTLLYAEDFYIEKWSEYHLKNVTLELHNASIYAKSRKNKNLTKDDTWDDKNFVAFRIDSVPERRPFLLSRDFVLLCPSGKTVEPLKGILYRIIDSTIVLAEFGDDFHPQHSPKRKYDVNFSFNRVCLKRSHQAIADSSSHLFRNFLFPNQTCRTSFLNIPMVIPPYGDLSIEQCSAINNISRLKDPPPYLIEGPLSTTRGKDPPLCLLEGPPRKVLSETGLVIKEAVIQICKTSPGNRILVTAPTNSTCDVLFRSLKDEIPESDIFRANAAFRELDGVPYDILPLCPFEKECFTCPSLQELHSFKVVLSTFVSSFRLHDKGISAGHFSHIFLVDASSATEPEALVVLTNLADETTVIVVTGATGDRSRWVRSDIARRNGLKVSYFERLFRSEPYNSLDPKFVTFICKDEPY